MEYRFEHFQAGNMVKDLYFHGGPAPGEPFPDFSLPTTEGGHVRKAELVGKEPVLLVLASVTCPMTASAGPILRRLHQEFGHRVRFVSVYVREAHPGERFPQPRSSQEKLEHARAYKERDRIPWTVAVDDLEGTLHQALDLKPSAAYLIDRRGEVMWRGLFSNDEGALREALQQAPIQRYAPIGESKRLVVPMLRGMGLTHEVVTVAGGDAQEQLRRSMPPLYYLARLADTFRPLPPLARGAAAVGVTVVGAVVLFGTTRFLFRQTMKIPGAALKAGAAVKALPGRATDRIRSRRRNQVEVELELEGSPETYLVEVDDLQLAERPGRVRRAVGGIFKVWAAMAPTRIAHRTGRGIERVRAGAGRGVDRLRLGAGIGIERARSAGARVSREAAWGLAKAGTALGGALNLALGRIGLAGARIAAGVGTGLARLRAGTVAAAAGATYEIGRMKGRIEKRAPRWKKEARKSMRRAAVFGLASWVKARAAGQRAASYGYDAVAEGRVRGRRVYLVADKRGRKAIKQAIKRRDLFLDDYQESIDLDYDRLEALRHATRRVQRRS